MLPTIAWDGDDIVMIDQRKLPGREIYVRCKTGNEVAKAITTMVIRGAPAIGVAAAMGLALGARRSSATGTKQFAIDFQRLADVLAATRPTAVNLFWAIEAMKQSLAAGVREGEGVEQLRARLRRRADAIHDDDVASCRAIGRLGAAVMPDDARILTHCNAGALATAGYGTALGVVRGAIEAGKRVEVFADETRPFLQGARLTAWELVKDGIATTVITDGMTAAMMAGGQVNVVVVGADRIAANGDTANKIGTYGVAILAHAHGIPFYVAAPWSTIDLQTPTGADIPIEERAAKEVTHMAGTQATPVGAAVRNPAFDVTPHRYIAGIVTERGIVYPPFARESGARVVLILGIETSCDETAAAVVEATATRVASVAHPLERDCVAGGDPS